MPLAQPIGKIDNRRRLCHIQLYNMYGRKQSERFE
ncbi:rCG44699 [Rattus norvegicus]|uniref:RCG44699 n=1 Tax=Rattus norvegicus TaxID=10116 RepID=A6I4H8_RAT|nr:rCG44699 [Rattus norvegicus]